MKKKEKSLHERAEECRRFALDMSEEWTDDIRQKAIKEFEQGEVAQYFRENAAYVTGLVVSRLKDIKADKPTHPFRPFDAETLVRLLSTCTEVEHEIYHINEDLDDEKTIEADESNTLIFDSGTTTSDTPTTKMQDRLRDALREYAQCAAIQAREIGSASLLDWAGILDILTNKWTVFYSAHIRQEEALRLVALHNSAADRLRLDKIIAALPSAQKSVRKAR